MAFTHPRIVPTPEGYEVWSGTYLVIKTISILAARDEYLHLLELQASSIEVTEY